MTFANWLVVSLLIDDPEFLRPGLQAIRRDAHAAHTSPAKFCTPLPLSFVHVLHIGFCLEELKLTAKL